ncbi:hypothetical protein LTR27_010583 [Elasticomyces elasticus]|nr:hypothetical protein LTR27_010583 [Elasticomyces elasticus]
MANDPRCLTSALLSFKEERIKLVVGPEQREFYVGRQPLEEGSEYFRLALGKDWKEGKSKVITLEDVDPDIVHRYLHFIYTGKVAAGLDENTAANERTFKSVEARGGRIVEVSSGSESEGDSDESSDDAAEEGHEGEGDESKEIGLGKENRSITKAEEDEEGSKQGSHLMLLRCEYNVLAQLYCFGERMQNERFKNAVINAFVAKTEETVYEDHGRRLAESWWNVRPSVVQDIYEGTPPDSPGRKLMVSIYVSSGSSCWLVDDLHHDFLLDLSRKFCKLREEGSMFSSEIITNRCAFPSHHESPKCASLGPSKKRKKIVKRTAEDIKRPRG